MADKINSTQAKTLINRDLLKKIAPYYYICPMGKVYSRIIHRGSGNCTQDNKKKIIRRCRQLKNQP